MSQPVVISVAHGRECSWAKITLEWLLPQVTSEMRLQIMRFFGLVGACDTRCGLDPTAALRHCFSLTIGSETVREICLPGKWFIIVVLHYNLIIKITKFKDTKLSN